MQRQVSTRHEGAVSIICFSRSRVSLCHQVYATKDSHEETSMFLDHAQNVSCGDTYKQNVSGIFSTWYQLDGQKFRRMALFNAFTTADGKEFSLTVYNVHMFERQYTGQFSEKWLSFKNGPTVLCCI